MAFISIDTNVSGSYLSEADVNRELHLHSHELAVEELQRVQDRTPVDTMALYNSARARSYESPDAPLLVQVYYSDSPQLTEWNRVYVAYQEGPPMGLNTYTNPPRQMLQSAETQDGPTIQAWVDRVLAAAEADVEAHLLEGITLDAFIAQMGTL